MARSLPFAPALALALGCGGPAGGDTGAAPVHTPGDYDFFTLAADDACLGGALEALFMPAGPDTPHAFTYPIPIPAAEDLPATYTIDLREPFVGMPITLTRAAGGALQIRGAVMESVVLGPAYGDCAVTMTVDGSVEPAGPGRLTGAATLTLTDPRGAQGLCPVFDASPCDVRLQLDARLR